MSMEKLKNSRAEKLKEWRGIIKRGGANLFFIGLSPTGESVIAQGGFLLGAERVTHELLEELRLGLDWDGKKFVFTGEKK